MRKIDKTKAELFKELEETNECVLELNRLQTEYEKARAEYEKLLDSTPDAMLFVNTQNKIVLVNAQFERIFGYSQDEIVGRELDILVPERYRKDHHKKVQKYFEHPRIRTMGSHLDIYARKKDGGEFPARRAPQVPCLPSCAPVPIRPQPAQAPERQWFLRQRYR